MFIGTNTAAVLRAYATSADKLPMLVRDLRDAVHTLRNKVHHVRIVVWVNPHYEGADFGGTEAELKEVFRDDDFVSVEQASGDIFVGVLNASLHSIHKLGFHHALIASSTAHHLVANNVVKAINHALKDGALAVGIVSPDNPITMDGAISNTCALWNIDALVQAGGFSAIDARPPDFYYDTHHQGVGEFVPLFSLQGIQSKPPLAIIIPDTDMGDDRTMAQSADQLHKLRHKRRRMDMVLAMLGVTREDLRAMIMPGYPMRADEP